MNVIVCVDENFNIGCDNKLLFNIKQDMEFFKEKTLNQVVVMGRKTFESLPNSSPLKNRVNVVMTTRDNIDGCICVDSVANLLESLKNYCDKEIYVIGGEQIYKLLLPYCDKAYITKVFSKKSGDTKFPNIDKFYNWKLVDTSYVFQDNGLKYVFTVYEKVL